MKKLVTLGLLVATVAFAVPALGDGGSLQDQEVQNLFTWSARAPQSTKPAPPYQAYPGYRAPEQAAQSAGSAAKATKPVPPYQEYPGYNPVFEIN